LKVWGRKVSGSKTERIFRVFLFYRLSRIYGEAPSDIFLHCVNEADQTPLFKDFSKWLQKKRSTLHRMNSVPSDEELMATFRTAEVTHWKDCEAEARQRRQIAADGEQSSSQKRDSGPVVTLNGSPAAQRHTVEFTLSLFFRLCVLLRNDEEARQALRGSGQPLSRGQQDAGIDRNSFWYAIGNRFNDDNYRPRANFRGAVDNVDPSIPPRHPISGCKLKDVWYSMRGPFSMKVRNFQKSGQNNPNLDGFIDFLDRKSNGELYAVSQRMIVLFVVLGMGADSDCAMDMDLFNLTVKIIPHGAGFDEAGSDTLKTSCGQVEESIGDNMRKRRKLDDVSPNTRMLCSTIANLNQTIADGYHGSASRGTEHGLDTMQRHSGNTVPPSRDDGLVSSLLQVSQSAHLQSANLTAANTVPLPDKTKAEAVADMEARAKAMNLLKQSYSEYKIAKEEATEVDDFLVRKAKEHYEITQADFDRAFGAV